MKTLGVRRFLAVAVFLLLQIPGALFSQEARDGRDTVVGKVRATIACNQEADIHDSSWALEEESTGRILELRGAPKDLRSGSTVKVRGKIEGSVLNLPGGEEASGSVETLAALEEGLVSGNRTTAILLLNLTDASLPSACTRTAVEDVAFISSSSISSQYMDATWGNVGFSGDAFGPFTIPYSTATLTSHAQARTAGDQAAANAGINLSGYMHRVYVYPNCPTWGNLIGVAQIPGSLVSVRGDCWNVKWVWTHELGHNLGMHHSSNSSSEYGDGSCTLGNQVRSWTFFNSPHKIQMGWVPSTRVVTATSSGTYSINLLDQNVSGLQTIKIPKPDTGENYYLSYRVPVGAAATLSSTYANKLNIHRWDGRTWDTLRTHFLAALIPGQTWTDSANGISVTLSSLTSTTAVVNVTVPTIPAVAPVLSLSPSAQIRKPGAAASYSLTVTNKDPSGFPNSTFAVSAVPPSGWTWTASPASLNLAPGASGTSTVTITSASTATQGTYSFTAKVADASTSIHNKSVTGTYKVDTTAPSTPTGLSGSTSQGGKTVTLTWTASTDNMGMGTYVIYRNGVSVASTASTTFKQMPGRGTYTYQVQAKDLAGNVSGLSAGVTVTAKR